MNVDLHQIAQTYIDRGITVVPTKKKAPYLKDYYNLSDEQILNSNWTGADGINILTGTRSGIAVLDIDILRSKEPEKYKEVLQALPKVFCGRTGNPDKAPAILFQYNGEKSRKWNDISVEFFGEKGNVVLPPSIHPLGNNYEWHGVSLDDCEVDDLPNVTDEIFQVLDELNTKHKKKNKNTEKEDVALSYESGRCMHGSHNKLSYYAVALRRSGLSMNTVLQRVDAKDKEINRKADFYYFECPKRKEFAGLTRREAIERFVGEVFAKNNKGNKDSDETEYCQFRDFFDAKLNDPRKCKISGMCVERIKGQWKPIMNRLKVLQSHCKESGLKHTQMEIHLERYLSDLDGSLLVDIPEWDGKDWIGLICSYIKIKGSENEVFCDYFKYWISRVFARMDDPINQNIFLLIRGRQGIGKDELVKNMFRKFRPYFSNFAVQPNREVDTWHQVARHPILHLEEFDQTGKLGVAFLKELITTDYKEYRLPYDRCADTHGMYGSFISTANVDNLFRDSTGNRRFAVFDIESIDWNYPKDFGLQVLAQGKALYEKGYKLSKESKTLMAKKIEALTPDEIDGSIEDMWKEKLRLKDPMRNEFQFHEIQLVVSDIVKISGWKTKTILSFLKRRGYSRKVGGTVHYMGKIENNIQNQDDVAFN